MKKNIRIDFQYDGSNFRGSQIQPGERTVQGEIENAIEIVTGQKISTIFSGRTDSGVHAYHQVLNFFVDTNIPSEKFIFALRPHLPSDINLLSSYSVPHSFNARFSAKQRTYRYYIRDKRDVFLDRYRLIVNKIPSIDRLNELNDLIIKAGNYKSMCSYKSSTENFLCDIKNIEWFKEGEELVFQITANRFLHNMIRIMVSVYLEYGNKNLDIKAVEKILISKDRVHAPKTISPTGLFLWKIEY
ncbi:MAG: tRNA pseudouridine(38-40) synthase TruA [Candidatus Delongbacteria bacterium]|nr:tRNA pseudouridine(38-40) synthase TruA [Candidatus Delongbacteria bacterium]MBN2833947.1 tRNA pseudouridine(38-40) synthase TruA [Candidatus Delongbacteria bacterium]